jgi:ADP-heptose:LPS heptosyltransferase
MAQAKCMAEVSHETKASQALITSAMHFACAIGVPSVSIFGPSDPGRYFSGGKLGFGDEEKHIALSPRLWCSPCNLIRRPPEECDSATAPECLTQTTIQDVFDATVAVLAPRP